jgi:hypothetical protein
MDTKSDRLAEVVSETLERELRLILEACAMVAGGHSRRVVVGSLRFGHELLGPARDIAAQRGVRVVPLWTIEDATTGLAIEAGASA